MNRGLHFAVAALVTCLAACGSPKSLGPTPLDQGIIVYIDAGFQGSSQAIGTDVRNLSDVRGPCAEQTIPPP